MRSWEKGFALVDLVIGMSVLFAILAVMSSAMNVYLVLRAANDARESVRSLSSVVAELSVMQEAFGAHVPEGFDVMVSEPGGAGAASFHDLKISHDAAGAVPLAFRSWPIPARR